MDTKEEQTFAAHPLYAEFYDYACHIVKGNSALAEAVATRMFSRFMEGEHVIITLCQNQADGIGDFASQMFYAEKLKALFGNCANVRIEHISFITPEKLSAAGFIMGTRVPDYAMHPLVQRETPEKGRYDVYLTSRSKPEKNLRDLFSRADLLLNISTPLENVEALRKRFLPDSGLPPKTALVSSFQEYDQYFKGCSAHPGNPEMPVYSECYMGMKAGQTGIRFASEVIDAVSLEKSVNFNRLSPEIKQKMLGSGLTEDQENQYYSQNTFAVAYIKSPVATMNFIALALKGKGDVNMLIDANLIKNIQANPDFRYLLGKNGVSSIEINENNGSECISLCPGEKGRVLRIFNFNFRDIPEQDKRCFYGLADYIAGSGDTSATEVISTAVGNSHALPFPFFENPETKPIIIGCLMDVLEELCKKTETNHKELLSWLGLLAAGRKLSEDELLEIHGKKDKICKSWEILCKFLYRERNADLTFKNMLVTWLFQHLIRENHIQDLIDLAESLGPDFSPLESLSQLAVKSGNIEAIRAIQDKKLDHYKDYPFKQYSLFHLAVYSGDLAMLEFLCSRNDRESNAHLFNNPELFKIAKTKNFQEIMDWLEKMKRTHGPALPLRGGLDRACINSILAGIAEHPDDQENIAIAFKIIAKLKKASATLNDSSADLSTGERVVLNTGKGWLQDIYRENIAVINRALAEGYGKFFSTLRLPEEDSSPGNTSEPSL